jgi:diguanylate cyclase (GGDEF)-like protein/PAS domain S-box-containing protein
VPLFITAVLALRAGILAASLAVLLLSGAAAWSTALGQGPFAGHDPQAGLLALWTYITAQACTSVLICGLAAELLASRRQQASLFQHADAGILHIDPEGRIGALNPRAEDMLGVEAGAFSGKLLTDLPHGNGARLARCVRERAAGGTAASYLQMQATDGSPLQVELQGVHHNDARGRRQTQLLLRDVTERMRAQALLAASEQRLRMVTNNMPALIAYMDTEQRFQFANKTFIDWFDLNPEDVVGKRGDEVFGEEAYRERRPVIEQVIRSGKRGDFERESHYGGRRRYFRSSYVPDLRADGSVQGLYVLTMDITELKAVEMELTRLARVDHLTGLPNRLQFEDKLHEALARARRSGQGLALLYIDIDHFKAINDSCGHAAGDLVLAEFARRLQAAVRSTDTVARLAGDEFVAVLEHLGDADEAALVATKIGAAMQLPIDLQEGTVKASASIGIGYAPATVGPRPQAAELMAIADAALYEAKRAGRNTFRQRQA